MGMRRRVLVMSVMCGCSLLMAACGAEPDRGSPPAAEASGSSTPPMPCDPGGGFPVRKAGCPDADPETGWLSASGAGLRLRPFRTLGNDAEGEEYARRHGEEFPFPNDYFDAPDGESQPLELDPRTVCTGIIRVGYQEPLEDHVVACGELARAAGQGSVPVAVWRSEGEVAQASELYRP